MYISTIIFILLLSAIFWYGSNQIQDGIKNKDTELIIRFAPSVGLSAGALIGYWAMLFANLPVAVSGMAFAIAIGALPYCVVKSLTN